MLIQKVALYARFSSDNQRTESIDAQVRAMNQFCKQNHWQVVATYTDEARSATTDNRPQFQQMIVDSSKGIFDIVLVHKLDRFSRDRYDSAIYKKRLKKNNVKLCSVLERIDDSPESIMMESVLEGMAEYYSKNLGREVMKGMKETALQCKHTGGCTPLGYDLDENKKLIINPHEAEAVKIIFQMFADGHGYMAIINYLNEHGYKTKRGQIFGKNSLYEILRNEKYTGVFVFNKAASKVDGKRNNHACKSSNNTIRIENGCPQIVSKELFAKVQRIKAANKRNTGRYHNKEFYLFTGKIFCGICGKRMQGNLRFSGRSKTRLVTYRCNTHRSECKNKEINKDYLDVYIVELLRKKIFNATSLKHLVNNVNTYIRQYNSDYDTNYESVKAEYDEIQANLNNITKAVEKGIITESLINRAEELEQKRAEIEIKLSEIHQLYLIEYSDFLPVIDEFRQLERNTEKFRTFIQNYVKKITVYPYHLEIEINTGLGIADKINAIVKIRRGELYGLFKSRIREEKK
ncbi:MAG: recombinase family protein [Ruminococcus flavefaciens]|nr:recombinase family protein [Ruminococcus flavefaciens]